MISAHSDLVIKFIVSSILLVNFHLSSISVTVELESFFPAFHVIITSLATALFSEKDNKKYTHALHMTPQI